MSSIWSSIRQNVQQQFKSSGQNVVKYEDEEFQEQILAQFYLAYPNLECDAFDDQNEWLTAGTLAVQGWRVNQEDAHLCDVNFDPTQQVALFGVFDGHNGPEIAQYAALKIPQLLKTNPYYLKKEYDKALEQVFLEFDSTLLDERINKELKRVSRKYEEAHGKIKRRQVSELIAMTTGTTAVVALLSKKTGKLYVANIGDSRCFISIKNKPYPMTQDHKPTDHKEQKRIHNSGSQVVNGRINSGLNLSRAFGDFMLKDNEKIASHEQAVIAHPDLSVSTEKFHTGDFIFLACDGIWNSMSEKDVCIIVRKAIKKNPKKLSKVCSEVIQKCMSPVRPIDGQIGGDNMTCLLARIDLDLP